MKVIFSRKGVDSVYGASASPIINNLPISLPIPYDFGPKFSSKKLSKIGKFVTDLTKLKKMDRCHPDPDLKIGAFGQIGGAQTHLDNEQVGVGSLFLFYGTFRHAEIINTTYHWRKFSRCHHRIFGWIFVNAKIRVGSKPTDSLRKNFRSNYPKYRKHPHSTGDWTSKGDNNTIYIAPNNFKLFGTNVSGFGRFKSTECTLLTHPEYTKGFWRIPNWINLNTNGCGMTFNFNSEKYWSESLETNSTGQEFVCNTDNLSQRQHAEFEDWLKNLFATST